MIVAKADRKSLARALGISVQAVGDVLNEKTNAFTAENNAKAASFLRCNAEFLATGEGPLRLRPPTSPGNDDQDPSVEIQQYATGGKMGAVGLVLRDQPGLIKSWRVTSEWVQKNVHNITSANNLAIVTGFGDSMRPLYNPGDPLLVDVGVKSVEFDAIYFFRVGDEGFIKRLQRIPSNGLLVISENRSYRDWTVDKTMDFEVFARVVKVWRGEDF